METVKSNKETFEESIWHKPFEKLRGNVSWERCNHSRFSQTFHDGSAAMVEKDKGDGWLKRRERTVRQNRFKATHHHHD
jgi:hypothetical protein